MRKQNHIVFPEARSNQLLVMDQFKIPIKICKQDGESDSPMLKFCSDEPCQFRKNQIKIWRNKLPSDFFKSNKPSTVSTSLNQRAKNKEIKNSPYISKRQVKEQEVVTSYDEEMDEQDNLSMKLTSCFGNKVYQFSPQKEICLTDRKYQSHQDQNQKQGTISTKPRSREHTRKRSLGKPSFFNHSKCAGAKNQIHLPSISSTATANPLRKRIQNARKLSDDITFHNQISDLNKKVSAVLTNSNIAPQIGIAYNLETERPKHRHTNTLEVSSSIDKEMIITFCNAQNKVANFFQQ